MDYGTLYSKLYMIPGVCNYDDYVIPTRKRFILQIDR